MTANDPTRGKAIADSGKYAQPTLATVTPIAAPAQPESDGEHHQEPAAPAGDADNVVDGAQFVLDQPTGVPAIWGTGGQVLWPRGEALMIAGGQGLGKTSIALSLLRELLGLGGGTLLGLPVANLDCRILYFAMDRPKQISRAAGRVFDERGRAILAEQLVVWSGPPPRDLAANPALLAKMANYYRAGAVVVDSLKDAAVRLSEDAVGAQWNRARQHLLAQGCQLLELHHTKKRNPQGPPVPSVDDIYGSTWLTSGCGSIVLLSGEPGDPLVGFRHIKQPAEEVGPWRLLHDQTTGNLSIDHEIDLVALVKAAGVDGLTAKVAAAAITEKQNPSRADVEKARRKLDQATAAKLLVRFDGGAGRGATTAWFLAKRKVTPMSRNSESRRSESHAAFPPNRSHG